MGAVSACDNRACLWGRRITVRRLRSIPFETPRPRLKRDDGHFSGCYEKDRAPEGCPGCAKCELSYQRCDRLWQSVIVLPSDYSDYGGDVVRWSDPKKGYPDCSSCCKWFIPLHDDVRDGHDLDWGVCSSPISPRKGLLTWEHQHGVGCGFEYARDAEDDEREEDDAEGEDARRDDDARSLHAGRDGESEGGGQEGRQDDEVQEEGPPEVRL